MMRGRDFRPFFGAASMAIPIPEFLSFGFFQTGAMTQVARTPVSAPGQMTRQSLKTVSLASLEGFASFETASGTAVEFPCAKTIDCTETIAINARTPLAKSLAFVFLG